MPYFEVMRFSKSLLPSLVVLNICLVSAQNTASIDANAINQAFEKGKAIAEEDRRKVSSLPQVQSKSEVRQSVQQVMTPLSLQMENYQRIFEEATRVLAEKFNLSNDEIKNLPSLGLEDGIGDGIVGQCRALIQVTCEAVDAKYRTYDGSCNNENYPSWGKANSCFESIFSPSYSDGISELRKSVTGSDLPNPRTISEFIHNQFNNPSKIHTHMVMQFGQSIAHDISWTPASVDGNNNAMKCCPKDPDGPKQCLPIEIPLTDPFYLIYGITCLNNVRASLCTKCELGPRPHVNQVSSFLDLSLVYGFNKEIADQNRANDEKGSLASQTYDGSTVLPESINPDSDACSYQSSTQNCFSSGEVRVNQHVALTSIHTVFLRYHNYLSSSLKEINPGWDDEKVFQEARRIFIAQYQMVVYSEFLPELLGSETMYNFQLDVRESGYTKYDPLVNPAVLSEFSTAAFRLHSTVANQFVRLSGDSRNRDLTRNVYFRPFHVYKRGGADEYIAGLADSEVQNSDRWVTDGVSGYMYRDPKSKRPGLDLAATNVLRGRDNGIAPYHEVVRLWSGKELNSVTDLSKLYAFGNATIYFLFYHSPKDIDLFTGGTAEKPIKDAILGPTFSYLVAEQFRRLKFGDRFYFEHEDQIGSFTPDQLDEIRKTRFSYILCQGSENLKSLQLNVFRYGSEPGNPSIECSKTPRIDLSLWKE